MEVTEVRVFPVDEDKLRAYVTITIDNCFVIRDLKIIRGTTGGYFVSMPSKKRKTELTKTSRIRLTTRLGRCSRTKSLLSMRRLKARRNGGCRVL